MFTAYRVEQLTRTSKARDPAIRQIAKDAETRLANDPHSGYRQWPSEPSPGPQAGPSNDQSNSQPSQQNNNETPIADLIDFLVPLSPTPESEEPVQQSAAPSPQDAAGPSTFEGSYTSPYGQPQPTGYPTPQSTSSAAPIQPAFPGVADNPAAEQQPQYQPPQGPPLASAAPARVALSRRRETKILLSIDGDGVRGLSSLLLVESLVNAICVKIGQRLDPHQIFDLTGGSSLGGVIALLLCRLQMYVEPMCELRVRHLLTSYAKI
jgi:calcium-independent phospholipase A2-gamma